MATYTANYNLKKPATTDLLDVDDLNGNADIIDSALNTNATAIAGKQDTLTFDNTPTASSTNPVTSGGVYSALSNKQNTLTAGTGISIVGDTISATGGGGGGDLPAGTADGDILVWDDTAQDWNAKQVRLPFAYQEVQYIESTGTQYIDTGVTYNANTRIVVKEAMNYNSAVFKVEGCFQQISSTYGAMAYGHITANQGKYSIMCKTKTSTFTDADWVQTSVATDGTVHTLDIASGSQKIDSTEIGTATIAGTWQSTYTIFIFARNNYGGGASPCVDEKMYSYRIYDGSALVRDFVPCYHKDTGNIGLFDLVNYKFYGNNGTGTFTKGADV